MEKLEGKLIRAVTTGAIAEAREAVAHLCRSDPILGRAIAEIGPLRLSYEPTAGELFEELTKAMIYQQISGRAAATIYQRLQAFYGETGPAAGDLLATPTETLRSLGISRTKAIYLRDLAEKVLQGFPTLGELAVLEDEAIIKQLTQIKGVGRWTAQILLIFRLGRPDVLPVEDLGIRKALQKHYQLTDLPDRQTVARIGAPWQPYRSLACLYLWQSLSPTAIDR